MQSDTHLDVPIEPQPEFAQILRDEPFGPAGDVRDSSDRVNTAFDRLLVQSGTRLSAAVVLRLCVLGAIASGGSVFVIWENLLATALMAAAGALVPIAMLAAQRRRRQAHLLAQLPVFLDEIGRAVRLRRNLPESLAAIAARTNAPLGDELRLAVRRTTLGLGWGESLRELPVRTGLASTTALATALTYHEQNGGDLLLALDSLSQRLRKRGRLTNREQSTAVVDKMIVWLGLNAAALILAFVVWGDPQQGPMAFDWLTTRSGIWALGAALAIVFVAGQCGFGVGRRSAEGLK